MGRGGECTDATSNIALQRSAIRSAHMASGYCSRPLNAALDICVRGSRNDRRRRAGEVTGSSVWVAALVSEL
jgi:hypothetical protein